MNFDIFLLKYTHLYDSLKVKVKISITIISNPNLLLYLQYESNIIMNKSRKKKKYSLHPPIKMHGNRNEFQDQKSFTIGVQLAR